MTSQRAVIEGVDLSHQKLTLRTDDGDEVCLTREDAGADRLGYGYATTVHRGQGATVTGAHLFADGGGRELAYVAMSRARQSTHIWAVADDQPQAVDDLRRDWSTRRTPTWAIDTAIPDPTALTREQFQALPSDQQAHVTALLRAKNAVAGQAVRGIHLPDRASTLGRAEQALETARQARADPDTGAGVWAGTEAGQAVRDLAEARAARQQAESTAERGARWRERHAARKDAADWARREADAQQRCAAHVTPEIARLDGEIALHQETVNQACVRFESHKAATQAVTDHGLKQQRDANKRSERIAAHRDRIDGVPSAAEIRRAATRREQLRHLGRVPEHELPTRPAPSIEM